MAFSWNRFAYTNFHELNLDWFNEHFKEIFEEWEELYNTLTQWKDDTDADLAQWKEVTLADMDTWERELLAALDEWKVDTGNDISDWESGVISDLNDWKETFLSAYESLEDRVEAIVSDTEDMVENLAVPFSTSDDYSVDDYVIYNGTLYRFVVNHSAGAWDSDEVLQAYAMNDVTTIKNAILKKKIIISELIKNYYIDNTNGALTEYSGWSATGYIDVSDCFKLYAVFPTLRSVYNAFYDENKQFIKAFYILTTETEIFVPENAKYMRLSARSDAFETADIQYVSKTVTVSDTLIHDKQARIIMYDPSMNIAETTRNGVTYSFTNGYGEFSGTPSATFTVNLEGGVDSIPIWIQAGETYYVSLEKKGSPKVYFNIQSYDYDGNWIEEILKLFEGSGAFTIPSLSGIKGILIRVTVSSVGGGSVDNTGITYHIYKAPKREKRVRVMQNNLGKFRFGYSSNETHGLTEAEYVTKLVNYKKMYGKYRPDILCVQEMNQYMDKAQTHDTFTSLYNPIYFNNSFGGTSVSFGMFANIDGTKFVHETLTDTIGGVSYSVTACICEAVIDDAVVGIASTALNSESGHATERAAQLTILMNRLSQYKYGIIGIDLNVYNDSELTSLIATAEAKGYTAANYDYWGRQDTYVPHPGQSYYNKIDNILTKGNIKIVNFEVLTDETPTNPTDYRADNKLASDHIPIVADLIIF